MHNHIGRPVFKLKWKNQYVSFYKCTKCDVTRKSLTEKGLVVCTVKRMKRARKQIEKILFSPSPLYKIVKKQNKNKGQIIPWKEYGGSVRVDKHA
jgi:hypothetical protein